MFRCCFIKLLCQPAICPLFLLFFVKTTYIFLTKIIDPVYNVRARYQAFFTSSLQLSPISIPRQSSLSPPSLTEIEKSIRAER